MFGLNCREFYDSTCAVCYSSVSSVGLRRLGRPLCLQVVQAASSVPVYLYGVQLTQLIGSVILDGITTQAPPRAAAAS